MKRGCYLWDNWWEVKISCYKANWRKTNNYLLVDMKIKDNI